MSEIARRRYQPADRPYVASTWLRSWAGALGHAVPAHGRALVEAVLDAGEVEVLELPTAEGPLIAAWIASGRAAIHYVYTRHSQRRAGLARRLVETAGGAIPWRAATIMTPRGRLVSQHLYGRVLPVSPWPPIEDHHAVR